METFDYKKSAITFEFVLTMVRYLVRNGRLFRERGEEIRDEYFYVPKSYVYLGEEVGELPMLLILQSLQDYWAHAAENREPMREELTSIIRLNVKKNGSLGETMLWRVVDDPSDTSGFLSFVYKEGVDTSYEIGSQYVTEFIQDRDIRTRMNELCNISNTVGDRKRSEKEMQGIEDLYQRAQKLKANSTPSVIRSLLIPQSVFDSMSDDSGKMKTGDTVFDADLGGGAEPGDCVGIMGPTGVGKSTQAIQLANNMMRQIFSEGSDDLVVYLSSEENFMALYPRFLSNGARIARDSITMGPDTYFGIKDPDTVKPYELDLFRNPDTRKTEKERFQEYVALLEKHLVPLNYSGNPDEQDEKNGTANIVRMKGLGGIPEILRDVRQIRDAHNGARIRALIIDHTMALCSRQANAASANATDEYYSRLKRLADDMRLVVAPEIGGAVWVVHQIRGAFVKGSPLRKPTTADGDGCASFCNNMSTVWALGCMDPSSKCFYRVCVKHRYTSGNPQSVEGMIMRHNECYTGLMNVTSQYAANYGRGTFTKRGVGDVVVE